MSRYDTLTTEDVLGEEMARVARALGTQDLRPVDMDRIDAPSLHEALAYWEALREDRDIPLASDFDPVAIPRLLSQCFMISVQKDPESFTMRVIGNDCVDAHDRNTMGEEVSTIVAFGQEAGRMMHAFYSWIVREGAPVPVRGPNPNLADGYTRQELVYLPFASSEGEITQLLGVSVYYRDPVDVEVT